jgi:hypothetical protein
MVSISYIQNYVNIYLFTPYVFELSVISLAYNTLNATAYEYPYIRTPDLVRATAYEFPYIKASDAVTATSLELPHITTVTSLNVIAFEMPSIIYTYTG